MTARVAPGLLAILAACGRVGFAPLPDDAPPTGDGSLAQPSVQSGSTVIPALGTSSEVALTPVDPAHSVLVFSVLAYADAAADALVLGELVDARTLHFERAGTGIDVAVQWSVISWRDWSVQRGRKRLATDQLLATQSLMPVDFARSVPLLSMMVEGGPLDEDDKLRAYLDANREELRVELGKGNPDAITMAWQVVTLPTARVYHRALGMTSGQVAFIDTDPRGAYDPARSFVASSTSAAGTPAAAAQQLSTQVQPDGSLAFTRREGTGELLFDTYLVELPAARVQHIAADFVDMQPTSTPLITSPDAAAFALGGAGDTDRTDSASSSSATGILQLGDASVNVVRSATAGAARIPVQVIELQR